MRKNMTILKASNLPTTHAEESFIENHLRELAAQVRKHSRSSTESIIAIGKALIEAKEHLDHGQFCKWVSRECYFNIRSVQNYIRTAEFATREGEIVSLLNPATLYRLARPKTPPDVVRAVVDGLRRGFVPTETEVMVLIFAANLNCEKQPTANPQASDPQATQLFARELHARLGDELVSQLIGSRWSDLRKHLRNAIEQPQCITEPHEGQTPVEVVSDELPVKRLPFAQFA
jgi:hypothetical protein